MLAKTIQIDSTFNSSGEIFPFGQIDMISGISLVGNVELHSDTSLVRVILEDWYGVQYMIFETYPLISEDREYSFSDTCDETCFLDQVRPYSIKIQVIDAIINIPSFTYSVDVKENAEEERFDAKRSKDATKIQIMNRHIPDYDMNWVAGDNSIVARYYDEKKNMFGDGYNMLGFEYYAGGVFELLGHQSTIPEVTSLTKSFDWRSRHGANNPDPDNNYYDGDELGSGWLTDVRDQFGCGSCWAFSANGIVESLFNLYNNRHLDFSISVKEYLCSDPPVGNCGGGIASDALSYLAGPGVPNENCFQYKQPILPLNCVPECNQVDSIFKITSSGGVIVSDNDDIKIALIQKGPLSVRIPDLNHYVVLNGYTFKDNRTIWIIKNSYGTNWGDYGFGYFEDYQGIFDQIFYIYKPELYVNGAVQNLLIDPRDEDGDGFCNWGLGPNPTNFPECINHKDCDDSNPYVGPYDEKYNCSCLLEFENEIETIDYEGHWDTPMALDHIVDIADGWSLEITSIISFGPGTKIIIEPGASLVIDGGKLTKACNELWEGIEVHGHPELRQTPEYQGKIEIKNDGTIEFAKTAIVAGKKDNGTIINGYEGGIIIAEEGTFRDNEIDIEMYPYSDNIIVPPFNFPNQSRFKKCNFITDALLYEYSIPSAHMRLDGINGIQITACEFKNDVGFEKWTVNNLGIGILSFNSTFSLNQLCSVPINPCPEEDLTPCLFMGLNYGIRSFNWLNNNYLSIDKVQFVNNVAGIYLSGVNYAQITRNTFSCVTGINEAFNGNFLGAIYLDGCTGYKVEENSIQGPLNNVHLSGDASIGIYIRNSGTDDNEVYNNTIRNQHIAIQAEGINKGERAGLCLKCNKLIDNINDFIVSPDPRIQSLSWGIKELQGSFENLPDAPAGNEFRIFLESEHGINDNGNLSKWNFYNDGDHVIYIQHVTPPYKYKPGDNNYYNDNTFRRYQTIIDYDEMLSCPSHIQDPLYKDYYDPLLSMETADAQVDLYQTLLDSIVDGGDTYSLNQDISTGLPNEALELSQQLMNESPYLSDTVIKSAIYKENVFPNAMIRDIMVLNPQTAKTNEFINLLDYRMVPMSDTMIGEIMQGQNIIGSKEILESHLSYWNEKKVSARNDLIRSWLSDTTIYHPYDSFISLYQNENEINAKYDLASCYLNTNQVTQAISCLQLIPTEFQLSQKQVEIYEDYLLFYTLLKKMNDSSHTAYELDSVSISGLMDIMDHGYPQISGFARSLLVNGDYIDFIEDVAPIGDYNKSSKIPVSNIKNPIKPSVDILKLFPNPSTDYFVADFNTKAFDNYGKIIISDLHGKICKEVNLMKHHDQIVISLDNLASGTYYVLLQVDNNTVASKKLVKINE